MTTETFLDGRVALHEGDCLDVLDALPANSVDAVITDPPYHFNTIVKRFGAKNAAAAQHGTNGVYTRAAAGFMGKQWDGGDVALMPETWEKILRVLKPGGHVAAFSAPKCVHRMGMAIELAGFEIRDRIQFLFDPDPRVAAFLDSLTAAQADALFRLADQFGGLGEALWTFGSGFPKSHNVSKAIDALAAADRPIISRWSGWGTALKPAYEPIVVARKPLAEKLVARQVLATGTGALNIDAWRVGWRSAADVAAAASAATGFANSRRRGTIVQSNSMRMDSRRVDDTYDPAALSGRWPANLAHDGSASVAGALGDAARFFYSAKADAHDRIGSGHPTVKPVDLMQWLARMLCPPGGTILDPFAGTGTTGEAAWREGFSAVLIEREAEYRADIARRMDMVLAGPAVRRAAHAKAMADRRAHPPRGLFEAAEQAAAAADET